MSEAHLIETNDDGVVTLTMNRPGSLNALSGDMMGRLREAIPRLAADDDVRVVILTGAGKAFCAGGDVKGMAQRNAGAPEGLEERASSLRTPRACSGTSSARPMTSSLAGAPRFVSVSSRKAWSSARAAASSSGEW